MRIDIIMTSKILKITLHLIQIIMILIDFISMKNVVQTRDYFNQIIPYTNDILIKTNLRAFRSPINKNVFHSIQK